MAKRRKNNAARILPLCILIVLLAVLAVHTYLDMSPGSPQESDISSKSSVLSSAAGSSSVSEGSSSPEESPVSSGESTASSSGISEPEHSEASSPDGDAWNLVVVSKRFPIPDDFDYGNINSTVQGYPVDDRIAAQLEQMIADAAKAGYSLQIVSGYRTKERSKLLYENKVSELLGAGYGTEDAAVEAARWIAPPGTSEHHTGLVVDIVQSGYFNNHAELNWVFDEYPEFTWLYEHCADYGFILRYPQDKQEITDITYEPWHYRYVGVEDAKKIMEAGLCLEEYMGLA